MMSQHHHILLRSEFGGADHIIRAGKLVAHPIWELNDLHHLTFDLNVNCAVPLVSCRQAIQTQFS